MPPVNPDTPTASEWDANTLAAVRRALSEPRLGPYLLAADGDIHRALELYDWNGTVASSAFGTLEVLEVVARNGFNDALVARYGPDWWRPEAGTFLEERSLDQAVEAIDRYELPPDRLSTDKFVSEMSFGFWTALVARRYDQQWRDALHRAFVGKPPARRQVQKQMYRLNEIRNRIAHHEMIWSRDLARFRADTEDLLRRLAPAADAWYRGRLTRLDDALAARPDWLVPR